MSYMKCEISFMFRKGKLESFECRGWKFIENMYSFFRLVQIKVLGGDIFFNNCKMRYKYIMLFLVNFECKRKFQRF